MAFMYFNIWLIPCTRVASLRHTFILANRLTKLFVGNIFIRGLSMAKAGPYISFLRPVEITIYIDNQFADDYPC